MAFLKSSEKYLKFFAVLTITAILGLADAGLISFFNDAPSAYSSLPYHFPDDEAGGQAEEPLPKSEEKISSQNSEEYLHNEHSLEVLACLAFLQHDTQHASIYSIKYGELISPPPDRG